MSKLKKLGKKMQNSGVILLNKPVKISSNSAVNKVKYLIGAKKAGHLGTLDPLASGVLPVTFGKATRLFDFFLTKQKTRTFSSPCYIITNRLKLQVILKYFILFQQSNFQLSKVFPQR